MTYKVTKGACLGMILALAAMTCYLSASAAAGPAPQQETFASPWRASRALFEATQAGDEAKLLALFGPQGKPLISSGDPQQDQENRQIFVRNYEQVHRLVKEPDGTVTLFLGPENWPFPIPLVQQNGAWYFDTSAGEQEILFRRIGKNELSAIQVCHELVAAEKEHYAGAHPGEAGAYASKFVAENGEPDGLYHPVANGTPEIGPLLAQAGEARTPFHGYYFRILSKQGKDAAGGAKNYIVDGKMTGGFAFVAYPAQYRSTGVMTFIVNQDGTVYERDLGVNTFRLATAMKAFNPSPEWKKVEE